MRRRAADVAEQRQAGGVGGGAGDGEADAEDRVGAQPRLVRRAVEVDQLLVDQPLLAGVVADQLGADDVEDVVDGLGDALAAVALTAVAELDGLEGAGGGAAGHRGPGDRPVVEGDLDLDGGVSARVEDLPRAYGVDAGHGGSLARPRSAPTATPRLWPASPRTTTHIGRLAPGLTSGRGPRPRRPALRRSGGPPRAARPRRPSRARSAAVTTASSRSPSASGLSTASSAGSGVDSPARPARRTSAAPQAAAGCERETPSVGERRCFSACLISSQPASTCATSARARVPEHVRVPADQLVDQVARRRRRRRTGGSAGGLGGHPGVEDDLQQDVAELLAHRRRVVVDDRVVGLVRLLEQVAAQRGVRLLGVPRAAARGAQPVHDGDDVEQAGAGRLGGAVDHLDVRAPRHRAVASRTTSVTERGRGVGVRDVGDLPAVGPQRRGGGRGTGQGGQRPLRRDRAASRPGSAGPAAGN